MTTAEALLTGTDAQSRHPDFDAPCCLTDGLLASMTDPVSAGWARSLIREQRRRCEAFDIFYDGFMHRFLGLIARLVERLRGAIAASEALLLALSIPGQMVVFSVARAVVLRTMSGSKIDETGTNVVRARLHRHLRAPLAGFRP